MARVAHRTTRPFVMAAVGAFALAVGSVAAAPAQAQSAYGYAGSSVTVDYSVLDHLGPAPHVPDSRFVLRVPEQPGALHHGALQRPRVVARRIVRHPTPRPTQIAQVHPVQHVADIVQDGSVTIDYGALPSPVASNGPRIVLRRPGTVTVAAASPVRLIPPAPQPTPTPAAPSPPRVATAPSTPETRSELHDLASLLPIGGVALAATRSPTEPVAARSAPQSDSRAIRFAPGAAELQGDAPSVLNTLAQTLKATPDERVALVAYASGDADQAIEARRVSLARAVAVRAYLIQHGVASTRIDVRALGNRVTDGGSADRVDLVTTGS
ncbi:MAG: OmpA family protein [Stellaceae bacterium]